MGFWRQLFGFMPKNVREGYQITVVPTPEEVAGYSEESLLAQQSFSYFWRELYWDRLRETPRITAAGVRAIVGQTQWRSDKTEYHYYYESFWLTEITFDGEWIEGTVNQEYETLPLVKKGDRVRVVVANVLDWLFVQDGKAYGGIWQQGYLDFMRFDIADEEDEAERQALAESYDEEMQTLFDIFGKFEWLTDAMPNRIVPETLELVLDIVRFLPDHETLPKAYFDHPMSVETAAELSPFRVDPFWRDPFGNTHLHLHAILGNLAMVNAFLAMNVDNTLRNQFGKTAKDYAEQFGWAEIAAVLHSRGKIREILPALI